MTAATTLDPVHSLQDEAACPICLNPFRDPVSVECGHSFCINQTWRGLKCNFPCPQCSKVSYWKKLQPNRHLANMSEQLALRGAGCCPRHHEPLRLYCEQDQQALLPGVSKVLGAPGAHCGACGGEYRGVQDHVSSCLCDACGEWSVFWACAAPGETRWDRRP